MSLIQLLTFLDTLAYLDEYPSLTISSKPYKNLFIFKGRYGFIILHSYIFKQYLINNNIKFYNIFKAYIIQLLYSLENSYFIVLLIKGIGFRFELKNTNKKKMCICKLRAGYHLPITFKYNYKNFKIYSPKPTRLILNSLNWSFLYSFSKHIKNYRIPDNYKNKGIVSRYEKILKKIVQKTK